MRYAFLLMIIIFALAGCVPQERAPFFPDIADADTGDDSAAQMPPDKLSLEFDAQYIRTDGYDEGREYPIITVIKSYDELAGYYHVQKDNYDLDSREAVYADSTIGFIDAVSAYDEAFFEEKCLVLIVLEEPSGSYRHNVTNVVLESGVAAVSISRIIPENFTDDMAEWHIIIELAKEAAEYEFRADITDVNVS